MPEQSAQPRWFFSGNGEPPFENPQATSNVAIIPGLANAHTHLEFSDLAVPISPAEPFTTWIRNVIAHRRSPSRDVSPIIATGIEESTNCGTDLVGEIATDWQETGQLCGRPNGVTFCEVIGFRAGSIQPTIARLSSFLQNYKPTDAVQIGISPHAPYSVHPELYRQLINLAHERRLPVAVHLAETKSEIEFLQHQTGEFREMLEEFGIWEEGVIPPGSKPLDYLKPLAKLECALVIHGNYLDDEEIAFLAKHPNIFVVYCPRTHHYFGHEPHPWLKMKEAGVSLAIGTDSRASNPDLNVFNELKFLAANFPNVDKSWLLDLGTIQTQRALGMYDPRQDFRVGGKLFQTTRIELPDCDLDDPYELLFHPESQVLF